MQHANIHRRTRPRSGLLSTFTATTACGSALFLMTGCHATPKVSAFAETTAQEAAEARLQPAGSMEPLAPFDEHFYVTPPDAQAEVASAP